MKVLNRNFLQNKLLYLFHNNKYTVLNSIIIKNLPCLKLNTKHYNKINKTTYFNFATKKTSILLEERKNNLMKKKEIVSPEVEKSIKEIENKFKTFYFDNETAVHFKFSHLCSIYQMVEETNKRDVKLTIFSNFFKMLVNPKYQNYELLASIVKISIPYLDLIQNKYKMKEDNYEDIYNIDSYNENYIQTSYDIDPNINIKIQYTFDRLIKLYIKDYLYISMQDIENSFLVNGDISQTLYNNFEPKNKRIPFSIRLTIDDIINAKDKILKTIGTGTEREKLEIIKNLFDKCTTKEEALYLCRLLTNKLRISFSHKGFIKSIESLSPYPSDKTDVNKYFRDLLNYLKDNLFHYNFTSYLYDEFCPGVLFNVALSKPSGSFNDLINSLTNKYLKVLLETKYDGERTQIHYDKEKDIFIMGSRALENQNDLYYNLAKKLKYSLDKLVFNKTINLKNIVFDGEIVIFNKVTKKFGYFQDLRKKENINNNSNYIYFVIAFDILYLNDQVVYNKNLEERKLLLYNVLYNNSSSILVEIGKVVDLANNDKDNIINSIKEYFKKSKTNNCEGLIIKQLGGDTEYKFDKRHWIKLKSIEESRTDTVDLVPIAGNFGKGNRSNYISSFLMAIYDKKQRKYVSICKLGTGFTIEDLENIYIKKTNDIIKNPREDYVLSTKVRPNVFFNPTEVWEVGFDSFTQSIAYSALKGLINQDSKIGVSLRFPRFIRFRDDKKPEDSTNQDYLMNLYMNLLNNGNSVYIDEED